MLDYNIRNSKPEDLDFILDLVEETFKEHIIKTHGKWNLNEQHEYWQNNLDPAYHKIIESNKDPIGIYAVSRRQDEIVLDLIFLLPEYQGLGIGSNLLFKLIEESKNKSKKLRLRSLRSNRKAIEFYLKKGFKIYKEDEKRIYLELNS
jgi:GNAT superfamily N-acetyltransferase